MEFYKGIIGKMTSLWNFTKELLENDHFIEFYKGIIGK